MIKKSIYPISIFFMGCFLGFLWEILVYWLNHSKSILTVICELRGVLHGPWVPIYGFGCVLIYLVSRHFTQKPLYFFLSSIAICGTIEYATSWILETIFHARWWDYSNKFMNLNGRIYLMGLLFFGIAGMLIIYLLEPVYRRIYIQSPTWFRYSLCLSLTLLFALDVVVSLGAPNLGIGVSILS